MLMFPYRLWQFLFCLPNLDLSFISDICLETYPFGLDCQVLLSIGFIKSLKNSLNYYYSRCPYTQLHLPTWGRNTEVYIPWEVKVTHPISEYVSLGFLGANEIHVIKEGLKYISHICPSYTQGLQELCIFPHSLLYITQDVWVPECVWMCLCFFFIWIIYVFIYLFVLLIHITHWSLLPSRSAIPNPSHPSYICHC